MSLDSYRLCGQNVLQASRVGLAIEAEILVFLKGLVVVTSIGIF